MSWHEDQVDKSVLTATDSKRVERLKKEKEIHFANEDTRKAQKKVDILQQKVNLMANNVIDLTSQLKEAEKSRIQVVVLNENSLRGTDKATISKYYTSDAFIKLWPAKNVGERVFGGSAKSPYYRGTIYDNYAQPVVLKHEYRKVVIESKTKFSIDGQRAIALSYGQARDKRKSTNAFGPWYDFFWQVWKFRLSAKGNWKIQQFHGQLSEEAADQMHRKFLREIDQRN